MFCPVVVDGLKGARDGDTLGPVSIWAALLEDGERLREDLQKAVKRLFFSFGWLDMSMSGCKSGVGCYSNIMRLCSADRILRFVEVTVHVVVQRIQGSWTGQELKTQTSAIIVYACRLFH